MKRHTTLLLCISSLIVSNIFTSDNSIEPKPLTVNAKPSLLKILSYSTLSSFLSMGSIVAFVNAYETWIDSNASRMYAAKSFFIGLQMATLSIRGILITLHHTPVLTIDTSGITILKEQITISWNDIMKIFPAMLGKKRYILVETISQGVVCVLKYNDSLTKSYDEVYQTIEHFIIAHQKSI